MQSFKQWRMLNESLFPLGLTKTPNINSIQSQLQLDEKKKNMDKNPEVDDDEDYEDEEGDEEDGDDEDDVEEKGDEKMPKKSCDKDSEDDGSFPAFMKKKAMKKKMKNECDCDSKKPLESDDGDEDDEEGEDDDDYSNDEDKGGDDGDDGEDEKMGGSGGGMKRPLGFMKKKMKKNMKKKMKKEATNPQNDFLQSFNSYTAPENQITSEDAWWSSVNSHFSNPNAKFNDGFTEYMEDYLIDPEAQKNFEDGNDKQHGPKPGEVGYAPEGRVGGNFFGS